MKAVALLISLLFSFEAIAAETSVKLALNWKPEPEFGGYYAAQLGNHFKDKGLKVEILPGGAGEPVTQMIAAGKVEFGISSGDEVVVSRARGADVVALFAVYQVSPMAVMVHKSLGLKKIGDVFQSKLTLAMERGLPYFKFLEKKYGIKNVKVVPYTGGVAQFLHDKNFAQQGFVTSEPLVAQREGADPQTFLVSDAGYDPYAEVIVTSGAYLKKNPETVKAFVEAVKKGWTDYLANPDKANEIMGKLNSGMDALSFKEGAAAQKPLIVKKDLGSMSQDRWQKLINQLVDLKVIDSPIDSKGCFAKVL